MAEAVALARGEAARSELVVTITGKVEEMRQAGGVYYSTIKIPAADEYSSPMPFEVRSQRPLGPVGSVQTISAKLSGFYRKSYKVEDVDSRTGVIHARTVRPVVNALDVVEP